MPWSTSRPNGTKTADKYRTPEHRAMRKTYAAQLERDGHLTCAQPVCVEPTRTIRPDTPWAAGHDDAGTHYIGPVHRTCNQSAAAVAARARQDATTLTW